MEWAKESFPLTSLVCLCCCCYLTLFYSIFIQPKLFQYGGDLKKNSHALQLHMVLLCTSLHVTGVFYSHVLILFHTSPSLSVRAARSCVSAQLLHVCWVSCGLRCICAYYVFSMNGSVFVGKYRILDEATRRNTGKMNEHREYWKKKKRARLIDLHHDMNTLNCIDENKTKRENGNTIKCLSLRKKEQQQHK